MTSGAREIRLFAGGYSWTETPERGITVADLDQVTGEPMAAHSHTDIPNPFHLVVGPSGRVLYVASNVEEGRVHALLIDDGGKLQPINDRRAGAGPIHLGLHPGGGSLVVVNHDSGDVMIFPIEPDGALGPVGQRIQHLGSGADPHAQGSPHPHMAVFDGGGTHLLVPDKGTDKLHLYRFDPATGQAAPHSQVHMGAGFGPRCLVPHRGGHFLYVLGEIQSKIVICGYAADTGALWTLGSVPTVPAGREVGNAPSGLVLSPDGRFLYAANRGHDSIAIFRVRGDGSELEPVGHVQVGEPVTTLPWELRFGWGGEILYAANLLAGTVVAFSVDPVGGSLTPVGAPMRVPGAATLALG